MPEPDHIADHILTIGRDLFSSIECDIWRDRVVVYARLRATPNLERALEESERLLGGALGTLETQDWIAAVHWSERMCRTIVPRDSRRIANERSL
ncbi:MAG TPA: hypothetical protein VGL98_03635 [Gammaproteobacteria bacterium]